MIKPFTPRRAACGLALLAAAVVAALGWVSVSALRLEAAQREAAFRAEVVNKERRALWRLDSSLLAPLGVENNRPFTHYYALHGPAALANPEAEAAANDPASVPSPLLSAELPEWMALHLTLDPERGWESPQVISPRLAGRLQNDLLEPSLAACTDDRRALLNDFRAAVPAAVALRTLAGHDAPDGDAYTVSVPALDEPALDKPRGAARLAVCEARETPADPVPPPRLSPAAAAAWGAERRPADSRSFSCDPNAKPRAPAVRAVETNGTGAPQNPNNHYANGTSQVSNALPQQQVAPAGRGVPSRSLAPDDHTSRDGAARQEVVTKLYGAKGVFESHARNNLGFNGAMLNNAGVLAGTDGAVFYFAGYAWQLAPPTIATVPGLLSGNTNEPPAFWAMLPADRGFAVASRKPAPLVLLPGERKPGPAVSPVNVRLGPLRPHWFVGADGSARLCLLRSARTDDRVGYQGVLVDWAALRATLKGQVDDLYGGADFQPLPATDGPPPDRAMTALPVLFVPGEEPVPPAGEWSPLRWGLVIAWAAALLMIAAVALGGRAVLAMSARRVRFASAVAHELRTPLTALQLHLDLLNSGLVADEATRAEYLATIAAEADRLNRSVQNVLDFARLENRTAAAAARPVPAAEIHDTVRQTWADRLARDGFELVTEDLAPAGAAARIDPRVLEQVLGNLIDNARKYAKAADDRRIWVRVCQPTARTVAVEVEDRGPGVPANECRAIFRPFHRGAAAHDSGGTGLGLSLARQWIGVCGGTIRCGTPAGGAGTVFRIELPAA